MQRGAPVTALVPALLLAALITIVFWPLRDFPFIGLDDPWYVYHNPHVLKGLSWETFTWSLTTLSQTNWHPLTWVSHLADVSLFGLDAGKHHLVNLALHAASVAALSLVLTGLTGARRESWAAAALFGVHPLRVESVAWVAERKDVLSALLFMLAIAAYLRYVRDGGRARYWLLAGVYGLGLTAKPMLVALPFVLLLLDWWPLGRLAGGTPRGDRPVLEKVPLLLMSAASGTVTYLAQLRGGAVNMMESHYLWERAANAARSYALYLADLLWPARLSIFYPFPDIRAIPWQIAGAAVLLMAISCAAFALRRRLPHVAMGWCWYLVTLVPVIGLVKVGLQSRADRYTYLPSIGLFVATAWTARQLPPRPRHGTLSTTICLCVLLAAFSAATRQQVRLWRDDMTLFSHSLAVNPDDWIAHYIVGDSLVKQGRVSEGLASFREAVRLNPRYAEAHNNLGLTLSMTGKPQEALPHLQEAVSLDPDRAGFAFNYANLLRSLGRGEEAIRRYRRALKLDPDLAEAHNNLGQALLESGRLDDALAEFETALRLKPDLIQAQVNYRQALAARPHAKSRD